VPTATPFYLFRTLPAQKYPNCAVRTLYGKVQTRFGALYADVRVSIIGSDGKGVATTSLLNYIRGSTDRNYEINLNDPDQRGHTIAPLAPGTYTVTALDVGNAPVSPAVVIQLSAQTDQCGAGQAGGQVWQVDFVYNQ
jgi:hypothetical protein